MSTPCVIGIVSPNAAGASAQAITVNFDGYPSHQGVGETLRDHYPAQTDAAAIVALGDLSVLGYTLEPIDTIAYHRDKEESWADCKPRQFFIREGSPWMRGRTRAMDGQWGYWFDEAKGEWLGVSCSDGVDTPTPIPLVDLIRLDAESENWAD